LLLAKVLAQDSNLLVLDEPTNDLDLETIDVLEVMLAVSPGTVLVVKHDRDFLDRVATSILRAAGDGQFVEYAGGYTDMLAQLANRPEMVGIPATKTRGPSAPKQLRQRDASRRKLSFHEQHALDMLPKQIATL